MERGARGDRQFREMTGEGADRLLLVDRVAERPEERHCECLDALTLDEVACRNDDIVGVERGEHHAVAVDAFCHPDDAAPFHDLWRHHQPTVLVDAAAKEVAPAASLSI